MDINGVEFYEDAQDPKSPSQMYAADNARFTRSLQIRPDEGAFEVDRYEAAKALLGFPVVNRVDGSPPVVYISRSSGLGFGVEGGLPSEYPAQVDAALNPDALPFQWCTAIPKVEMLGVPITIDANESPVYTGARFSAEYNTFPALIKLDSEVGVGGYPFEGQALASGWVNSRMVAKHVKVGSRTITLPAGFMTNSRTGKAILYGIAYREAIGSVKYSWLQVPVYPTLTGSPAIPYGAIGNCLSCVNDDTFDNYPAGTLLLTEVEEKRYWSALGIMLADMTYTMSYLPHQDPVTGDFNGWNSYLVVDPTTKLIRYDLFTSDGMTPGATNVAYPPRDFSALFDPDQV